MRRFILSVTLLILIAVFAQAEQAITEFVSSDALAYVRIGRLPSLVAEIDEVIKQEGIQDIPDINQLLHQLGPIVPMLLGIEFEDFINLFGNELGGAFYGLEGKRPIVAILADVRHDPDMAQDTIEEIRTLAESNAETLPEPGVYRDVAYEGTENEDTSLKFGFVDNVFVLGFNGGFERIVDRKLGDGEPLQTNEKYQRMIETLDPQGQVWGYADLEKLMPIIAANEENPDPGAMALFSALETVGIKIDLTGHEHKLYLKAHEPDNPFIKLFYEQLFTERPALLSSTWLSDLSGIWFGINIGDLQKMLELGLSMAGEENGKNLNEMLSGVGGMIDFNLRKKFLPMLSGELGVMVSVPEGEFNPQKRPLDFLKLSPVIFLGLNDVSDFRNALGKISAAVGEKGLAQMKVLSTEEYEGSTLYRLFVSSDALLPGVALTPTVAIVEDGSKAGIIALSNHPGKIRELLHMQRAEPLQARIALQASVGEILQFIAHQEGEDLPESILSRLQRLTPLQVALTTSSEELTLSLISQDATWVEQLGNGVMTGVLVDQHKRQTEE